jgi:hypothetical protein
MGYIEETGAAQHFRDTRITQIYEGTNGIQAIDLVNRKLTQSGGRHVLDFVEEMRVVARDIRKSNRIDFGQMGDRLDQSLEDLQATTVHLQSLIADGDTESALAGATPFLRLFGLTAGGHYLARAARASRETGPDATRRVLVARFFAERLLPQTGGLRSTVIDGANAVNSADPKLLAG